MACVSVILLVARSGDKAALENMKTTNRDLREQIVTKDRIALDLQTAIQQLQAATNALQQSLTAQSGLRDPLDRLLNIQTQNLTATKALAVKLGAAESPELQLKAASPSRASPSLAALAQF